MKFTKTLGLIAVLIFAVPNLFGCGSSSTDEQIKDPIPAPSPAEGGLTPNNPSAGSAPSAAPSSGPGAPPPPPPTN